MLGYVPSVLSRDSKTMTDIFFSCVSSSSSFSLLASLFFLMICQAISNSILFVRSHIQMQNHMKRHSHSFGMLYVYVNTQNEMYLDYDVKHVHQYKCNAYT